MGRPLLTCVPSWLSNFTQRCIFWPPYLSCLGCRVINLSLGRVMRSQSDRCWKESVLDLRLFCNFAICNKWRIQERPATSTQVCVLCKLVFVSVTSNMSLPWPQWIMHWWWIGQFAQSAGAAPDYKRNCRWRKCREICQIVNTCMSRIWT